MSIIWWALLFIAAFWIIVLYLNRSFDLKKRGVTVGYGILMWRTKRGLRFIDRVARASKRGWRTFGTIGAIVGFILMILIFILLAEYSMIILREPGIGVPGAVPVIPGITIPLVHGLIAILSVLVVHEFAHGFVMRAEGLQVEYTGLLLAVVIPGAFVEPNEKQLKEAPVSKRLRVYGAGPFANICFGLVCFGILLLALVPKPGVYVYNTTENGPSAGILQPGDRLLEIENVIDNVVVSKVVIESYENFYNFMKNIRENDNLIVLIGRDGQKENFSITAAKHPVNENMGIIGVVVTYARGALWYFIDPLAEIFSGRHYAANSCSHDARMPWGVIDLLRWVMFLQLAIGLFNLLPALPLDGGYIVSGLVESRASARTARRVSYVLSFLVLAILIVNMAPLLWG